MLNRIILDHPPVEQVCALPLGHHGFHFGVRVMIVLLRWIHIVSMQGSGWRVPEIAAPANLSGATHRHSTHRHCSEKGDATALRIVTSVVLFVPCAAAGRVEHRSDHRAGPHSTSAPTAGCPELTKDMVQGSHIIYDLFKVSDTVAVCACNAMQCAVPTERIVLLGKRLYERFKGAVLRPDHHQGATRRPLLTSCSCCQVDHRPTPHTSPINHSPCPIRPMLHGTRPRPSLPAA
eukprot:3602494-Rhodomonas_salina.1